MFGSQKLVDVFQSHTSECDPQGNEHGMKREDTQWLSFEDSNIYWSWRWELTRHRSQRRGGPGSKVQPGEYDIQKLQSRISRGRGWSAVKWTKVRNGPFHNMFGYFWTEDNFTVNIMQLWKLGNSGLFKNNTHCLRREESHNCLEKYVVLNDSPVKNSHFSFTTWMWNSSIGQAFIFLHFWTSGILTWKVVFICTAIFCFVLFVLFFIKDREERGMF